MFLNPDKSLNLFSSKGELVQCDNALKAASNSALSIGCSAQDGCVLISYKSLSPLADRSRFHKVFPVCPTIGVTYSGLQPDFRAQLDIAQRICQDYFDVYDRFPNLDVFMDEFSLSVQEFAQKGGLRPFGTLLIFCGYVHSLPQPVIYQMDPSGSFKMVDISASGKESESAKSFLDKRTGSTDDNIVNSLIAIRENVGKEITNLDVSVGVLKDGKFKVYGLDDINEIFDSMR